MGPVYSGPLLSPVHEESGYGPSCPTGYKVMRCLPYRSFTARSRITSCRLCRDHPSRPRKPRAVLAAVKAWPGNLRVCGSITATASLDCGCARRLGKFEVGTEKRLSRTKKLGKASLARGPPRVFVSPPDTPGSVPLDSEPHTKGDGESDLAHFAFPPLGVDEASIEGSSLVLILT